MFDIHYHLLFGVDDGPRTIEDSIQMAEASIAEGVTHIVCTPHSNYRYLFQPKVIQEQLAILNEHLRGRITLGYGCDFHLSLENIEDALRNKTKYSVNGLRYLLVEFPEFGISRSVSDQLYEFKVNGITPIITHPERNSELSSKPEIMVEWLRWGCLVQITAASLLGHFGKNTAVVCDSLLKKNWVHIVASDAHNLEHRPPLMREAFENLKSHYGQATAERLCIHNPRAVFFGEDLPPQPKRFDPDENTKTQSGFFRRFRRG
jgi:protein-tyrosine phosphatase